jgi:hypothetical protein
MLGFYNKADFEDGNKATPFAVAGIILTVIAGLVLWLGSSHAATKIMNPNYHAMQSITTDMARLLGK